MKDLLRLVCALVLFTDCSKENKSTTCINSQARIKTINEQNSSVNNLITYSYDDEHRLLSHTGTDASYINYTYNSNGSVTYKNGFVETICFFNSDGLQVRTAQTPSDGGDTPC